MVEGKVLRLMKRVPVFTKMNNEEIEKIADQCEQRRYAKDDLILVEDQAGQILFIILKGTVKITRTSEEGREVIITILKTGDFFGELALLDGKGRSANVVAMDDSELLLLTRSEFLVLIEKHPQISIELLKVLANRIRIANAQIENLTLKNAVGRIGATLIRVAEQTGYCRGNSMIIPKLPVQQDLANMAGTARETISRVTAIFEAKKLIEKVGHRVIFPDFEKFKTDYIK